MSMTDIIRQQQELKDKFMPARLQEFLELSKKIKSYTTLSQGTPLESINDYRSIFDLAFYKSLQTSLLKQPDSSFLQELNILSIYRNPIFESFDFSKFSDAKISEEKVEEINQIQINESSSIKKIITDIYRDNEVLLKITSREFEEMIAEILRSQGFEAELTKQTRDNGYDILAIKPINGHAPLKYLVECKRLTNKPVGVEIVRGFKNVVDSENANVGIIVATSYFTRDAKKKKNETPYLLDFRDKDAVMEWVTEYSESFKLR